MKNERGPLLLRPWRAAQHSLCARKRPPEPSPDADSVTWSRHEAAASKSGTMHAVVLRALKSLLLAVLTSINPGRGLVLRRFWFGSMPNSNRAGAAASLSTLLAPCPRTQNAIKAFHLKPDHRSGRDQMYHGVGKRKQQKPCVRVQAHATTRLVVQAVVATTSHVSAGARKVSCNCWPLLVRRTVTVVVTAQPKQGTEKLDDRGIFPAGTRRGLRQRP